MLEVEDTAEALQSWASRMDDEEGEEDSDETYHMGEQAIDRIVSACDVDNTGAALFALIAAYTARPEWQAKFAALTAIKQTIEYVEDKDQIAQCAQLLLAHKDHEHPRIRFMALYALGQLANDQSPHFQESHHKEVMPIFMQKMDDPVDRVSAMSMSAFVSFGEELDNSLMLTYAHPFMEKLVSRLQVSQHRGVQEECITSIAVIAGVLSKDFVKYYDGIMPVMKNFVIQATGEKQTRLRGKAFECMSLLGVAVGREKFLPDAREALAAMMRTTCGSEDIQREYIKQAMERIVQCLKDSFKEFLPHIIPQMIKDMEMKEDADASKKDDDEEDPYVSVCQGDGKTVTVRSSKFQEVQEMVQLICTMAHEMKGAFAEYVPPVAQVMMPFLSNSDTETYFSDGIRNVTLATWAELIASARAGSGVGAQEASPIACQLLQTCMKEIMLKSMKEETDAETLCPLATLLADCIKNTGPGAFQPQELVLLVQRTFALIDESIQRSNDGTGGSTPADDDEDEGPKDWEAEEMQLRKNYEEMLGAVMEVSPAAFCDPSILALVSEKLRLWLPQKNLKVLALYLCCDLVEKLKVQSVQIWPVFMQAVCAACSDPDDDAVTGAVYCISMAAGLQEFNEVAPDAFRKLAQIVGGKPPKKRDNAANLKWDNSIAALFNLAKEKLPLCPPEVKPFELALKRLPIRFDTAEAKKVHTSLVNMVLAQNPALLGEGQANLGKILSIIAEIYHDEAVCEKDTEEKILQIFKNIPPAILQQQSGALSEKQQKKIEKMLSA